MCVCVVTGKTPGITSIPNKEKKPWCQQTNSPTTLSTTNPIPSIQQDEFLLLACDGVWDVMTNQEAIDFIRARLPGGLAEGKPVSSVAEELLDACLAEDPRKSAGIGGDNFTCLIVQLRLNGERPLGGYGRSVVGWLMCVSGRMDDCVLICV